VLGLTATGLGEHYPFFNIFDEDSCLGDRCFAARAKLIKGNLLNSPM
jgi:hypothetical protein